jgi:PadR family transcriptional regulator, regulatory protein AphA
MSLPHLLLGLLYRKPDSGYDLNKRFERTVAHFWTTDQSQIYRTLYKLLDKGWVEVEVIQQEDNPDKKIYSVTDDGMNTLIKWLQKPLKDEVVIRDASTGQVYFGDALEPQVLIDVQQHYIQQGEEKLQSYYAVEQAVFAKVNIEEYPLGMELAHATLQYGIRFLEMEINWRKELIQSVEKRLR